VLLEVVAHARDVGGHFDAVREAHAGDLADSRVRLLRGLGGHLDADAALEWSREERRSVLDRVEGARQSDRLGLGLESLPVGLGKLIDGGHVYNKIYDLRIRI